MNIWPEIPQDLIDHGLDDDELQELWRELIVELLDEEYANRTHGSSRTYDAGCRGPMCKKSVRERSRRRNQVNASERYKYVELIIEYWYPIAEARVSEAKHRLVDQLTS